MTHPLEEGTTMLRGLTTVNYLADDVAAAVDWYTELLGVEPYFSRSVEGTPAYAEFRIGDYQHELGILDRRFAAPGRPGQIGGAVVYWHVDDVQASFGRLLALGATAHEEPVERGPGHARRRAGCRGGSAARSDHAGSARTWPR